MNRKPARLLVVDDQPEVRATLCQILTRAGHQTHALPTAEETLEYLSQHSCDLILLDLHLPGMSGLDFLRSFGGRLPAQVVVMTGYPEVDTAVEAMHLGVAGYLKKPLDLAQLRQKVGHVLEQQSRAALSHEQLALRVEQVQRELHQLAAHLEVVKELASGKEEEGVPAEQPDPVRRDGLSRQEREVLVLLGQGQAVKQIAAELEISERTVSTLRQRMLKKLELKTTAALIKYAVKHGLAD